MPAPQPLADAPVVTRHRRPPPEAALAPLLAGYMAALRDQLRQHFDSEIDADAAIRRTLDGLRHCLPPHGAIATVSGPDGALDGMGLLRSLRPGTGELTRVFVRPERRGRGIGRALVADLIDAARGLGHSRLVLDSACWQVPAHRLCRSLGFREIGPYPESEIGPALAPYMVFLQLDLTSRA